MGVNESICGENLSFLEPLCGYIDLAQEFRGRHTPATTAQTYSKEIMLNMKFERTNIRFSALLTELFFDSISVCNSQSCAMLTDT